MQFIEYIGKVITPIILFITIFYGILEKKNVFNLFIDGVVEGEKIVINLFPTLLALLVAVAMLNSSGITYFLSNIVVKVIPFMNKFSEMIPFILLRPISGSTSNAMATTIMQKYGTDTSIGIITSLIMGSTETTIYVISLYGSKLKNKNLKPALFFGIMGDILCVITAFSFYYYFYK